MVTVKTGPSPQRGIQMRGATVLSNEKLRKRSSHRKPPRLRLQVHLPVVVLAQVLANQLRTKDGLKDQRRAQVLNRETTKNEPCDPPVATQKAAPSKPAAAKAAAAQPPVDQHDARETDPPSKQAVPVTKSTPRSSSSTKKIQNSPPSKEAVKDPEPAKKDLATGVKEPSLSASPPKTEGAKRTASASLSSTKQGKVAVTMSENPSRKKGASSNVKIPASSARHPKHPKLVLLSPNSEIIECTSVADKKERFLELLDFDLKTYEIAKEADVFKKKTLVFVTRKLTHRQTDRHGDSSPITSGNVFRSLNNRTQVIGLVADAAHGVFEDPLEAYCRGRTLLLGEERDLDVIVGQDLSRKSSDLARLLHIARCDAYENDNPAVLALIQSEDQSTRRKSGIVILFGPLDPKRYGNCIVVEPQGNRFIIATEQTVENKDERTLLEECGCSQLYHFPAEVDEPMWRKLQNWNITDQVVKTLDSRNAEKRVGRKAHEEVGRLTIRELSLLVLRFVRRRETTEKRNGFRKLLSEFRHDFLPGPPHKGVQWQRSVVAKQAGDLASTTLGTRRQS
ncbi:unnamed protein product [Heligmosomoides polygyrus]|uniref:SET domain-containing protein n=1 Tax=Heligmosomoides polygyrus TaxID=6339 RepID=A0A3P8F2D3_HELPZ|nr:unnamed protein product [Heligmosomoides polygyrus]